MFTHVSIKPNQVIFTLHKTITSVKLHKTFYVPPNPEPAGYSHFSALQPNSLFQSKRQMARKQFDLCGIYPKESNFQSMC